MKRMPIEWYRSSGAVIIPPHLAVTGGGQNARPTWPGHPAQYGLLSTPKVFPSRVVIPWQGPVFRTVREHEWRMDRRAVPSITTHAPGRLGKASLPKARFDLAYHQTCGCCSKKDSAVVGGLAAMGPAHLCQNCAPWPTTRAYNMPRPGVRLPALGCLIRESSVAPD